MEGALSVIGVAVLAFAATNLDNLLLLVALAPRECETPASLVGGALLASAATLALGIGASLAADLVPQRWLGALGFVPLALGLRELGRLLRSPPEAAGVKAHGAPALGTPGLAGVLLANSGDTLAALVPLLAETRRALLPLVALAVLTTALLGCGVARWTASHARLGPLLQRIAPRLVPLVLIAVGLYVLANTAGDALPDPPG